MEFISYQCNRDGREIYYTEKTFHSRFQCLTINLFPCLSFSLENNGLQEFTRISLFLWNSM